MDGWIDGFIPRFVVTAKQIEFKCRQDPEFAQQSFGHAYRRHSRRDSRSSWDGCLERVNENLQMEATEAFLEMLNAASNAKHHGSRSEVDDDAKIKDLFEAFDSDRNGRLDHEELTRGMLSSTTGIGFNQAMTFIRKLYDECPPPENETDETLTLDQFKAAIKRLSRRANKRASTSLFRKHSQSEGRDSKGSSLRETRVSSKKEDVAGIDSHPSPPQTKSETKSEEEKASTTSSGSTSSSSSSSGSSSSSSSSSSAAASAHTSRSSTSGGGSRGSKKQGGKKSSPFSPVTSPKASDPPRRSNVVEDM